MLKAHENVLFRKKQIFMPTKINNLTAYKKALQQSQDTMLDKVACSFDISRLK